jgi:hypothetical protein
MRLGVRLGPFHASTSTRRRRRKSSGVGPFLAGVVFIGAVIFWPLALGQRPGGGYHGWVYAIAIPYWVLLGALALAYAIGKSSPGEKPNAPVKARNSGAGGTGVKAP